MTIGFQEDIRPIFQPFVACMKGVRISTVDGLFQVLLDDYGRVKLLHREIQDAIHGHDPATRTAHPMPPSGPLPDADIAKFDRWVAEGMRRTRSVA